MLRNLVSTSRRAATVTALVALAVPPAADARPVSVTYATPGAQEAFTVPAGVTRLDVVAIGGSGGRSLRAPGGTGAKVTAQLAVTPGATLVVVVGENGAAFGADHAGGRGGAGAGRGGAGGAGTSRGSDTYALLDGGGGGGGASAIVTCVPGATGCSPLDRILVAGAGGGGSSAWPALPAARGGDGGTPNGGNGLTSDYGGGGAIGDTGGEGPADNSNARGHHAAQGGGGTDAPFAWVAGPGGGGGGGGWAGGAGGWYGGGGGGSSHAPAGATYANPSPPLPPSVTLTYDDSTPPVTTITSGPSGSSVERSPSFTFTASESGATFACRLDSSAWEPCTSPKAYTELGDGEHSFEVRATDTAGNVEATPQQRTFVVAPETVVPPTPGDGDGNDDETPPGDGDGNDDETPPGDGDGNDDETLPGDGDGNDDDTPPGDGESNGDDTPPGGGEPRAAATRLVTAHRAARRATLLGRRRQGRVRARRTRIRTRLVADCPSWCRVTARLAAAGGRAGTLDEVLGAGGRRAISLRLSRAARGRLRTRGRLTVTISVSVDDRQGPPITRSLRLRLVRPSR